ncbi:MAG: tyrosine--tRNA ligase [Alphaproteobacteria bacterium]|nr:tyrosine--tRNA ligase [Alphaproteobacteria bacterium]
MSQPRSAFLQAAIERGFLHQCTDLDALDKLFQDEVVTAYIGFDATADSLHVGSLVPIMLLRLLQQTGHKPVVLMGGGTTKVGDPSGKDEQRKLLSDADIASNIQGIQNVFEKFVAFGAESSDAKSTGGKPTDAIMVNNADWLDALDYIPFLRDYGRHFSINRMLSFDSVKLRLDREQPLSFLEFNYMVLQSYDFLELSRRHGCRVQMGGSDQWGNIVSGIDLARRVDQAALFGLTTPLLTTATGAKMGKTADGAVWLNADRLSAYDYWQYWRNTHDDDVGRFLKLFTELPMGEIKRLESLEGVEINDAKKILANEATTLCHGADAAKAAAETAEKTFDDGGAGSGLPTIDIARADLDDGILAYDLFKRANLASSNGEARRLIKGGGARANDEKIANDAVVISAADINDNGVIKLSAGKKRHVLVRPV